MLWIANRNLTKLSGSKNNPQLNKISLSNYLSAISLTPDLNFLDNSVITQTKNSVYIDYVIENWTEILNQNNVDKIQALLNNAAIIIRLNENQIKETLKKLAEDDVKPEQYNTLIDTIFNLPISRRVKASFIQNIPTYLEQLKEEHFSYHFHKPVINLIQRHCTFDGGNPYARKKSPIQKAAEMCEFISSPRKKITIANSIFFNDQLKQDLINDTTHGPILIKERINKLSHESLCCELYSITDPNQRVKFAYQIKFCIPKINPKKQELFAAVLNPIIKLSECSWYNIFAKWYYGRQEKKNREFFESEIIKFNNQKNEITSSSMFSTTTPKESIISTSNTIVPLKSKLVLNSKVKNGHEKNKSDLILKGSNNIFFKRRSVAIIDDYYVNRDLTYRSKIARNTSS